MEDMIGVIPGIEGQCCSSASSFNSSRAQKERGRLPYLIAFHIRWTRWNLVVPGF